MQLMLTAAGGLAIGLALMIWALTERRARYRAELAHAALQRTLDAAESARTRAEADVSTMGHELARARIEMQRARDSDRQLRADVLALRDRLRRVHDPAAIKQWLDELLKVESLEPAP